MKKNIIYFHRNIKCGFSINKVSQTIIRNIAQKKEFFVPFSNASPLSIFLNIFYVLVHRNRHSINHITGDIHYCILGLIGCKSILTIHDTGGVDFLKYPPLKRFIFELLWYKIPLKLANRVVCISQETKKSVLRYTNRTDINVIYNAVDQGFEYFPKKLNLVKPRVLIIGTNPNKNLLNTFEALAEIDCSIVVIGKLSEKHINILKRKNILFENKLNLSDDEIIEEYKKCDIVSFVSLYEGFGMPVIEANAVGRPVVCSNIPVLREIAQDAAEFVNDPNDINDIRHAFEKLIRNPELCKNLIEKGLLNIHRFEKKYIQKKWENLYLNI